MFTIALCLHIFIIVTMVVIILIQRSEGGGFATFNGGVAGSRGVSDFLTKTTSVLVFFFFRVLLCQKYQKKTFADR